MELQVAITTLHARYEDVLTATCKQCNEEFGVTEEIVSQSSKKYRDDPEIAAAIQDLQDLEERIATGGASVNNTKIPESLTKEKTLAVLKRILLAQRAVFAQVLFQCQSQGASEKEFQTQLMDALEKCSARVLEMEHLSDPELQAAVQKYSDDSAFEKELNEMQEEHQRELDKFKA